MLRVDATALFWSLAMNKRMLIVSACLLALALLAAGLAGPDASQAQIGGGPAGGSGRYQMSVVGREGVSTVFVIDAETGNCWYRDTLPSTKQWTDMGSPAQLRK
jgi:hypothetical protein